jgi:hypothetical protein
VFSYVVVSDSGFAPNPFHGVCTLACCKPVIRRHAQVGDLIVGLSTRCERVVYAMKVSKVVGFDEYWRDAQGLAKRPDRSSSAARERRGDNIYEPLPDGGFRQLPSQHSARDVQRDLGGQRVLFGDPFCYFGEDGPPLPSDLGFLKVKRAHRCNLTGEQVATVASWFAGLPHGHVGRPARWPTDDDSWMDT